jgi:DNA modification methylase
MDKVNDSIEINDAKIFFKSSTDMSEIPSSSVNLIVTSPPYWTLKDYENEDRFRAWRSG